MLYAVFATLLLCATPSWAQDQSPKMHLLFDNAYVDMIYPKVEGNYVVYSQRVNRSYQVMQLKKDDLFGHAKDISPSIDGEVIRNGVALANGDIAYASNRLGFIAPWVSQKYHDTALSIGAFQSSLIPNHLDVSADGNTWIFDSTLEATRTARIANQFEDGVLNTQLLGQSWRMYHDRYWQIKTSYPASKSGLKNKFRPAHIFTFERQQNEINSLGDGFDASIASNGNKIVFVRENKGNYDLWQQNIDGSALKQLTHNTFADLEPSLSADGKRIAFISNRDAAGDILQTSIYTLEIATGKIQRLTFGENVTDGGPAWLDDKTIIFHSNRDPKAPNTDTVDNWRLWTVTITK